MSEAESTFRALVLEQRDDTVVARVRELRVGELPPGDVEVRVRWSGLNYKDALAVTNRGRIVRSFPMVPGIDMAGSVLSSSREDLHVGDEVLVTGYGSGEDHWGGFTQRNRLNGAWLVRVPEGMSARHAMGVGTAGLTAMLSAMALEEHGVEPGSGPIAVTGAGGAVGSFAVALLSGRGHHVVASTGRPDLEPYLRSLGAGDVMPRQELAAALEKPLESERWAGAVDTVGGTTLARLVAATRRHGSVAACGLVAGATLATTVFPFILRGVNLLGIDSNYCGAARRRDAWRQIAEEMTPDRIDAIVSGVVGLDAVPRAAEDVLAGVVRGRLLVDLDA